MFDHSSTTRCQTYNFLYLTTDVTEKTVQETNRYAQQYITVDADIAQRRSMVETGSQLILMKYKLFLKECRLLILFDIH